MKTPSKSLTAEVSPAIMKAPQNAQPVPGSDIMPLPVASAGLGGGGAVADHRTSRDRMAVLVTKPLRAKSSRWRLAAYWRAISFLMVPSFKSLARH